jgi:putative FmdB family regulatory protein
VPTYDYVCEACGHRLEVVHAFSAEGPRECPNCHSHALRKVFAAPAIVFRGSGWAKKDRSSGASTRAAAKAASGSGDSGAGSSGSDDSGSRSSSGGDSSGGETSNPSHSKKSAAGGSDAGSGATPGAVGSSDRTSSGSGVAAD